MFRGRFDLLSVAVGFVGGAAVAGALAEANAQNPVKGSKPSPVEDVTSIDIPSVQKALSSQDQSAQNRAYGELGVLHRRVVKTLLDLSPQVKTNARGYPQLESTTHPGRLLVPFYTPKTPQYLARHIDEQDWIQLVDEESVFNALPCAQGLVSLKLGALGGVLGVLEDQKFEPGDKAYELYVHVLRGVYGQPYLGGTSGAVGAVRIARDWARDKKEDPKLAARYQRLLDGLEKFVESDRKFNGF